MVIESIILGMFDLVFDENSGKIGWKPSDYACLMSHPEMKSIFI